MLALETTYYSPEKKIINHHHDNKIKNIRTEIKTPSKHLELKYLPLGIVEINLIYEKKVTCNDKRMTLKGHSQVMYINLTSNSSITDIHFYF